MHRMEVFVKDWDRGLGKIIRGYGVPYQEVEDVKQDIYLDFMKGRIFGYCPKCGKEVMASNSGMDVGDYLCSSVFEFDGKSEYCKSRLDNSTRRSYFDIYKEESEGGQKFLVFLSSFTKLRCLQFLTKGKRSPLGNLEGYNRDGDGVLRNPLDFVEDRKSLSVAKDLDIKEFISCVRDRLKEFPVRSVSNSGDERSLSEIFNCICLGMTQKEIAKKLKYSEPSVCLLVKKIQEVAKGMGLKSVLDD